MRGLRGQVIVLAGAASGIGAATASRLAEEGAKVVVGDIEIEGARAVVERLERAGGSAVAVQYDQGDWQSVEQLVASAQSSFGRIDGIFPNAIDGRAVMRDTDLLDVDFATWDAMLQVGLTGYFYLIRAALPAMLEQGRGTIVCTSSDASTIGEINRVAYGAAKAGVNALVRHVATRWGREGIRINAIRPFALVEDQLKQMPPQMVQDWQAQNRSGRIGTPDEAANVAAFLFSDDAAYVNGQIWSVNGGMTLNS